MNYEQRYKEALEMAKVAALNGHQNLMEGIFPELAESEDEKIRKQLITAFKSLNTIRVWAGIKREVIIAWLEKQGEQKSYGQREECLDYQFNYAGECKGSCAMKRSEQNPTDKIEPKFKVGDWITNDYCAGKVIELTNDAYLLDTGQGIPFSCEHNVHLWTIQYAKDGDVLVNGSNIFIFHFINDTRLMGYCHVNTDDGRFYDDIGKNECFCLIDAVVNPATKEQRDLLFQKMYEAGYTFDFEKKELKKIKFRVGDEIITENEESLTITKIDKEGYWSNDLFICDFDSECVWDLVEKKPTEWSLPYEKNETAEKLIALAEILEMDGNCLFNGVSGNSYGKFLRVLAKELTEVKLAWSKEDEKWAKYLKEMLDYNFRNLTKFEPDAVGAYNWLETIKQRIGG